MELHSLFNNFANPPILFFLLGVLASLLKVELSIPNQIAKFLSLYLLFSIGFQGGTELQHTAIFSALNPLIAAIIAAVIIPIYTFFILKRKLSLYDAAAIAATYGSVSAVTFVTAVSFLQNLSIDFGGYMIAALALMESPAIVIGLCLVNLYTQASSNKFSLLRKALLDKSVFLILGSLLIGYISTPTTIVGLKPFTQDIFKGMLSFFLLDMGNLAAKRLHELKSAGAFLIPFALVVPLANALLAIVIAKMFNFSVGDSFLFTVLCASASYIAVPAAMRATLPQANPALYIPLALGITFPFNIIGLPLYMTLILYLW